ncbi:hypothetical protein Rifp1Sym_ag00210 [endosymbiont of Riftia pachyptila (vent Ph05)]|uniref:Uncharacterized protein n=2 Tax=sulfur-oxidizing symbionts TaxID=32036 RepID=G2FCB1_9GAMM|nr:hypothetical protein Rifp1Sym_ag00210 [endosymbiont of Riftia pachyptila (vent Ph05)]EGW55474.1 hypothetical protein TevJSym_ac00370 [endosymbiont of Tevnia jerichonana (vent Tica)]
MQVGDQLLVDPAIQAAACGRALGLAAATDEDQQKQRAEKALNLHLRLL